MLAGLCALSTLAHGGVSYKIDTVAGSDWVGDGGRATRALLLQAEGVAIDSGGNLYIADAAAHRIRKVTAAGVISTIAGTGARGFSGDGGPAVAARLNTPYGLALDGRGNLYIADLGNARVRRVAFDGTISTIAGGDQSTPLVAPRNLALDAQGNLYVSDFGAHRVYRLEPDGSLAPAAGNGFQGFSGDTAAAARAQLSYPTAIAIDRSGALYIADSQNRLIRKVVGGLIFSIARAATPTGLTVDVFGALYIADRSAGQIIRVPPNGPSTALPIPAHDLTFGLDGYLYATDAGVVRRVSFAGANTVVAGGGSLAFGDLGAAAQARLNHPSGVSADSAGNFYAADRDNHRIRRIAPDGTITTVAGTGDPGDSGDRGLATQAMLNSPAAVSADAAGNLYIADTGNHRVRKVTPGGVILPVAGAGGISPVYAVADAQGNVYIADSTGGSIRKVNPAGVATIVLDGLLSPRGLALDATGNLYFTEAGGRHVRRLGSSGDLTSLAEGIWSVPRGVAVSAAGDVFVADTGLQRILRVDPSGQVSPIAGDGSAGFSGDGDSALAAQLGFPWDVAIGPQGAILIADLDNNRIRRLTPEAGILVEPIRLVEAVNAASLQPGPLAPGMLLALRGAGLSAAEAGDTQVWFDTTPAAVLSADSSRLVVRVPALAASLGSVQIDIRYRGVSRALLAASLVAAAPGLFADASGHASATNEDGAFNSITNPAAPGSVVAFYGTGEGLSGLPVSMRIGDYLAEILYAGPVLGYPGLLQINARVPAGYIPPGPRPVTITVGEASSQPGVIIEVR